MPQEQRSALQAYRNHLASYGKGKGKGRNAGRNRAAAHDAMPTAQGAVPAWVMPISQVAEMVAPKRDAFDVVIVDEASQAGIGRAVPAVARSPRDCPRRPNQCAPPVSGMGRLQAIQDRLLSHLPDMPPMLRQLYTPATNLYQLLSTFFPKVIPLEEHFRCMPEIIGWSSRTFYNDKLQPLRQFGGERLDPLVTHFVEGAVTQGRDSRPRNPKEAEAVADCLARLVEDPVYQDKTMGVIALQGPMGQVKLLEQLINERIPAPVCEHPQIRVGNPDSFQGDERHVIPQFPAGNRRIDLVVVGARSRLAVECDGDRFHSARANPA
ncbi:AAA domain-containing protein [Streptomyces sundarbansensis]